MTERPVITLPAPFVADQLARRGEAGRALVDALPGRVAAFCARWGVRPDGAVRYGTCALVVPVVRADGTGAVLKLQEVDDETVGEPVALRAWGGDGAVRLLEYDDVSGTMLLERLGAGRTLADVTDVRAAVLVIAALLRRLTAVPAPAGLRGLGDVARGIAARADGAVRRVADPGARELLGDCAAVLRELLTQETHGDRLLHWDLHYDNVLAADREPWLAIDPKPLAGDPAFELYPALHNRFDPGEVRRRFDTMTDVLALDRERAAAWTLVRVLQFCLWETEQGGAPSARHLEIAAQLRPARY